MSQPSKGAIGGAAGEAGSDHRAGAAALIATYGLLGEPVPWLNSQSSPVRMLLEADVQVDDIVVDLADGSHVFIQAKNSGGKGSLTATMEQWCAAVGEGECTAADEVLLVVGQKCTDEIQALAGALDARRGGTSLTASAQGLVDDLKKQAVDLGLTDAQAVLLLDVAKIKQLEADENGRDEALGAACLNAAVVTAGHGMPAFQALRARLKEFAKTRTPSDLNVWRQWLTDAALPLTADAGGALAARLQAEDAAVADYRVGWAQKRDVLPLADLGLGLTSLPMPGLVGGLRVTSLDAPNTATGVSSDLVSVVRRQGRLLLVGRPGMGKSVALGLIAAEWAGQAHAPVPVWLRLRDLQECLPAAGPYRFRVADLVRAAVGSGDPSLAAGLARRIEAGEALLLLDALDEVHERQDPVVEGLAALISDLPSTVDVVVTSRHSSAAAASSLQLPSYELGQPYTLEWTTRELLEVLAKEQDSQQTREQWIQERTQRIDRSRDAEADLWRVPLLATLMVVTIARRPSDAAPDTPDTRASLLTGVLHDSVHGWDLRHRDVVVPGTDQTLAGNTLLDCYGDIAHLIVRDDAPWADARTAVASRLRDHWGLAAGAAATSAEKIIDYWDATAGVFITHTPRGALKARVRLFAEIGDAQWAVRDSNQLQGWMTSALQDADRRESARLAASLSPAAATELIQQALHVGGDALDLVYDALDDGAAFAHDALAAVRDAQLDRLPTIKEPDRTKSRGGFLLQFTPPLAARIAIRLADDDLTQEQTGRLVAVTAPMGSRQSAVVAALCICRTARQRATALTAEELDTLATTLQNVPSWNSPDLVEKNRRKSLAGIEPLVRAALTHLLPTRPDIAPALASAAQHTTTDFGLWLETELERLGFAAAAQALNPSASSPAKAIGRSADERAAPFRLLADLAQPRSALTASEAWHLDDAAAFVATLCIAEAQATAPDRAVKDHRTLTKQLCRATLDGTELDPDLVTAQLRSLDNEHHPDWGLLFKPSTRLPAQQVQPSTVDTDLMLAALRTGNLWLAELALELIHGAQSLPPSLPQQLADALTQIPGAVRMVTAELLTLRGHQRSLPMQDPLVRAGVARVKAQELASQHNHRDASDFLGDADLLVRDEAADRLTDIPDADRPHLEAALATPAQQWTCLWCGTAQDLQASSCANQHARPQPVLAAS